MRVVHYEEKQTDVNIAVDMLSDAWNMRCEQQVLCSNDSDLAGALAAVKRDKPEIRLGLVAPTSGAINRALSVNVDWQKCLKPSHLEVS